MTPRDRPDISRLRRGKSRLRGFQPRGQRGDPVGIERLERKADKKILTYGERIDRMRHLISRGRYGDARRVSIENASSETKISD